MKNNTFRRLLAMAAAGAMLTSIAACGSSSNDDTASNGSDSTSLISVNNSEPQNGLIPSDTNEMGGGRVIRYLFEGLVSFDAKGKQHLEVAESITPNEDATKYTIKLKKGWKFTNGEAVTAHSFADTWSFAANVKNAQKTASRFSTIKGYDELQDPNVDPKATLSGLSTPDDYTLVVELNKPDSVFPTKLAHQSMFPLPSVAFKDIKKFGQAPIGNGPYKFKSWSHDKNIIVVPNKDYKGSRKVSNKGIEYRVYTNEDSAYSDVLSGNLDVMDSVPAAFTKTFKTDKKVQAYSEAGSVIQTFTIPSSLDHFKNDEEGQLRRQAISMAINRENICDKVLNGTGTPAVDFTSPLTPGYSDSLKGVGNLKYNEKKAKELWEKANAISPWTSDDKLTFAYNADGGHETTYTAVVNSINNTLGSEVAATNPYPTFNDYRTAVSDRKVQGAFRSGWQPDYPSAENYLVANYASAAADGNGSNDGDYKNSEFDDLCSKAAAAQTTDEANKLYQQAQEILLNDLPAIPLYYANAYGVAATGVSGFEMNWQNLPVYENMTKSGK